MGRIMGLGGDSSCPAGTAVRLTLPPLFFLLYLGAAVRLTLSPLFFLLSLGIGMLGSQCVYYR